MKHRTTPYILEKDGIYYSFPSEKSACEFLGVPQSCVASAARSCKTYYGYHVIKAVSENEIYGNKRLRKIWDSQIKKESICHEILHGILVHLGYDDLSNDEKFVNAVSNGICQAFSIIDIEEGDAK